MIVRELLVKLGFNIDTEKFKQFENLSDAMKNDMGSVRKSLLGKLGINIDTEKFKEFFKIADDAKARMEHLRKSVSSPLAPDEIAAYRRLLDRHNELKLDSSADRKEALASARMEKRAIRAVNQQRRAQRAELKNLEKTEEEKAKRNRQRLNDVISTGQRAARVVALISAGVTAGIGLSIRGTLKDVDNFKTQKKPGEKTSSIFDKQQISIVDRFNKTLGNTKDAISRIRNSFVIRLLPALTKILEKIDNWIEKNKELIKQRIDQIVDKLSDSLSSFSDSMDKVIPIMTLLIGKGLQWRGLIKTLMGVGIIGWFITIAGSISKVVKSIGVLVITSFQYLRTSKWVLVFAKALRTAARAFGALTAASLRFMFTPVGALITALVGFFALLANEIYVTRQGGNSFLKDMGDSKAWKNITDGFCSLIDSLKKVWQWIMKVKDGIASLPSKVMKLFVNEDDALSGALNNRFGMMTPNDISNMPEYIARVPSHPNNYNQTTKHNHNNLEQKINFNVSFNVPQGTNAKELRTIEKMVKDELQKHTRFINEQTLAGLAAS